LAEKKIGLLLLLFGVFKGAVRAHSNPQGLLGIT